MASPLNTLSDGTEVKPIFPYVKVIRNHEMVHDGDALFYAAFKQMAFKKIARKSMHKFERGYKAKSFDADNGGDEIAINRAKTDWIKHWVTITSNPKGDL